MKQVSTAFSRFRGFPRPRLRAVDRDGTARVWPPDFGQLARWYFALLVPTLAFKWLYVRGIVDAAGANQSWVEVALGKERGLLRRAGTLFLTLRPDVIEIALVVAAFYGVGALLLRIRVHSGRAQPGALFPAGRRQLACRCGWSALS